MSLVEKINIELKEAMLIKDKSRLESLRAIKTSLTLHQTSTSSDNSITREVNLKFFKSLLSREEKVRIFILTKIDLI